MTEKLLGKLLCKWVPEGASAMLLAGTHRYRKPQWVVGKDQIIQNGSRSKDHQVDSPDLPWEE